MSNGPIRRAACAALAAVLIGGCGVDRDFDAAVRTNSIGAYDDYLRLHPDGAHAADARARLAALVEDREWQRAHGLGTIDAYQQYLRGYPQGAHAKEALVAIADLNLAAIPSTEAATAPPPSSEPAAKRPAAPVVRSAPAPAVVAAAPDGMRIQLGAFGNDAGANAAWQRLAGRHAELASKAPQLVAGTTADGRKVVRLQLAGYDRAGASAACAALAKTQDPCLVVPGAPSH